MGAHTSKLTASSENHSQAPAQDDGVTVIPINVQHNSTPEDDADLRFLRNECPRFRILVIGKANAGKTTILKKVCYSTAAPIIRDRDGKVLDPSEIVNPTDGRGIHDIDDEFTFSSNPGFVFHDSRGFEAGSVEEVKKVRDFIANRAVTKSLKDQLHAIWYCLPVDNDRPLTNAEMEFFESGTGKTPVVAIFTKYDGMILKEYNKLRFEGNYSKADANAQAPGAADELFRNSDHYLKRLQSATYPPTRYLRMQGMDKPGSNCNDLSKETVAALDSKKMRLLFVSVQQNNIGLCTEFALKTYIWDAVTQSDSKPLDLEGMKPMMMGVMLCYGHLLNRDTSYNLQNTWNHYAHYNTWLERRKFNHHFKVMKPAITPLATDSPNSLKALRVGIVLLIVVEDSFWIKHTGHEESDAFKLAWDNFYTSTRFDASIKKIDQEFSGVGYQDVAGDRKGELIHKVYGIIEEFRFNS